MLCFYTGHDQALIDMAGKPDRYILHHAFAVLDDRDDRLRLLLTSH